MPNLDFGHLALLLPLLKYISIDFTFVSIDFTFVIDVSKVKTTELIFPFRAEISVLILNFA